MATVVDTYVTKFSPHVDEQFSQISKRSLVTNQDYDWSGADTVVVYKINTAEMNDYDRHGELRPGECSRYGAVKDLKATTQEMKLKKDRSFTYVIDRLDRDETGDALNAAASLERQNREVIIPEVDSYTYGVMAENAGHKPAAKALTAENIYDEITSASEALDNALVPETERVLVVTPEVYRLMKKSPDLNMSYDIASDLKTKGVVADVDGAKVVKIAAARLPKDFGFMMVHPVATVSPVKLQEFKTHDNPPGISGWLVEGRIAYDAFVLDNKKNAIYYQAVSVA